MPWVKPVLTAFAEDNRQYPPAENKSPRTLMYFQYAAALTIRLYHAMSYQSHFRCYIYGMTAFLDGCKRRGEKADADYLYISRRTAKSHRAQEVAQTGGGAVQLHPL